MISPRFKNRLCDKQTFKKFVNTLLNAYRIIGPVRTECGEKFLEVKDYSMMNLDYCNTHMSVKDLFLPQSESLFHFKKPDSTPEVREENIDQHDRLSILFGVRPCDAAAIRCLDSVFKDNTYTDPYYSKKRDSTLIVALACTQPSSHCFCTTVGYGPGSNIGSDIVLFDLSDRYYIEIVTPAGEEIARCAETLLQHGSLRDEKAKEQSVLFTRKKIKNYFTINGLQERIDRFKASYWESLHKTCLGCGICTYFCPTCHCFDITDDCANSPGRRIRTWDSCMFPSFTLHASGHNPRPTLKERMRQRIMHKFSYSVKNHGRPFCVGCGRCIAQCPVNIDIRHVLAHVQEDV
jgi:sulfhydrogenase subunit beta (sulfur reductase)